MPQKKTKKADRVKKRNIFLIAIIVVVALVILSVIGKITINDAVGRQKLIYQQQTLAQTLDSMTDVYDKFVESKAGVRKQEYPPENRCTEISSKGTAKSYTCGTRAEVLVETSSEKDFKDVGDEARQSFVTASTDFEAVKDHPVEYFSYNDTAVRTIEFVHIKTGQKCTATARFDIKAKTTRLLFRCNLNTSSPIFKLED